DPIELQANDRVMAVAVVPANGPMWVGTRAGSIEIFDLHSGQHLTSVTGAHQGRIYSLIRAGTLMWSSGDDGVSIIDTEGFFLAAKFEIGIVTELQELSGGLVGIAPAASNTNIHLWGGDGSHQGSSAVQGTWNSVATNGKDLWLGGVGRICTFSLPKLGKI
ncbi:MAG TPA: hypothetical protein V6D20_15430, partial [Candidatus Obscuribacterales bacterium]